MSNSPKPIKLSPHFTSAEFACSHCGTYQVDMRFIGALEALRAAISRELGKDTPLTISSGYRCPAHNAEAGGVTKSQHQFGRAADVLLPKGLSMAKAYELAESVPEFKNGGIGLYPGELFIHVDSRGSRARWARVDGKYVGVEEGLKAKEGKA